MRTARTDMISNAKPLATLLLPELEHKILELTIDSVELWKANSYHRYGNYENDFTAALVGQMRKIVRQRGLPFKPQAEYVIYTDEVYDGFSDPNKAARIDIAVSWSLEDTDFYSIECKRLSNGKLSKEYVIQGMERYRGGRYAADKPFGAMIGYVISGRIDDMPRHINDQLKKHPTWSETDRLVKYEPVRDCWTLYSSRHKRDSNFPDIRLVHMFIDLTSVVGRDP